MMDRLVEIQIFVLRVNGKQKYTEYTFVVNVK